MSRKKSNWEPVTHMMQGIDEISFAGHESSWFTGTWYRALCYSAYYKFAAKMIGKEKRVLDVGCKEGFGTWILAKECGFAKGIDLAEEAIAVAAQNWKSDKIDFGCENLQELGSGRWDAVVTFDVTQQILQKKGCCFFKSITRQLSHDGVAVIGISPHRLDAGLFHRLWQRVFLHFRHVFMFSASGQGVHTGFLKGADHWIALGCRTK